MEIFLLSSTIVTSVTLNKVHKLYFMNNLIKNNYKLDDCNYDKSILYIIPIVNIGYLIKNIKKYNIKNIEYLKKNNIITPLTSKEKDVYEEYPNITTTLNINLSNNKSNMILIDSENNIENTLYITNEGDNYHINHSEGPISKLPKVEQYRFLEKELELINDKPKVKIKK